MATTPDSFRVGPTHASRPSKMVILVLIGVVIGFFALTLSHDPAKEAQQSAAPVATQNQ